MKNKTLSTDPVTAIATALHDGGCEYATNFPGFHSHDIFVALGGKQISLNEKVAYQAAFGASLAGKRSVVTMKNVGLNVALDEFVHSILSGVNAGLVIVLTEDLEGESSPEKQDSRPIIDLFGGLWFEPYSIQNAYDLAQSSLELSEKLDVPIVIRLTNSFFRLSGAFQKKEKSTTNKGLESRRSKYISSWNIRDENAKRKNKAIQRYVENLYDAVPNPNIETARFVFGCANKGSEALEDQMRIFSYPPPFNRIASFMKQKRRVLISEEGNNYAFKAVRSLSRIESTSIQSATKPKGKELAQTKPWHAQEKLFKALQSVEPSYVVADEGTFTDESTKTTDVCLCMGSSVGITMGLADVGISYPFCVIGDGSFIFGGFHALFEAIARNLHFCVIILDNGGTLSTGHQTIVSDLARIPLTSIQQNRITYSKCSTKQIAEILQQYKASNNLSLLYVKL